MYSIIGVMMIRLFISLVNCECSRCMILLIKFFSFLGWLIWWSLCVIVGVVIVGCLVVMV